MNRAARRAHDTGLFYYTIQGDPGRYTIDAHGIPRPIMRYADHASPGALDLEAVLRFKAMLAAVPVPEPRFNPDQSS